MAARGIECAVYERAQALTPVGAGLILHPSAVLALRRLGLDGAVAEAGQELLLGTGMTTDGIVLQSTSLAALRDKVGAGTFGIHRARLHELLARGFDGIELGRALVNYDEDADGVTAHFADGTHARGALLVGADGLRSRVRAQLLGEETLRYAGYTSWRGIANIESPIGAAELREIWGRGARFGIVPTGPATTYWFAVSNAPEGQSDDDSLREVREQFASWSEPIQKLLAATERDQVLRTDVHDRKPVSSWSRGRVTLLGDAAHPMTPNLGQGACMAIEDALVLADSLAQSSDHASALSRYEARRVPRTTRMVNDSWRIGKLAQLQNPLGIWLRNLAMRSTPPGVVEKQMLKNAQVDLGA